MKRRGRPRTVNRERVDARLYLGADRLAALERASAVLEMNESEIVRLLLPSSSGAIIAKIERVGQRATP